MIRLAGKVAFITGAAGGIGSATCLRFIEQGACVLAADISDDALNTLREAAGNSDRLLTYRCDVTSTDSVKSAIAKALEKFGKLTTLCNTAGGSTPADGRVTEAPEEEFWRAIKLDLFGTFLCCKYGIPALIKAGGGSVINYSSMVALMSLPERDCYTAAKGGVAAITRSMAHEYAADKIRVNAIAPGLTLSPRARGLIEQRPEVKRLADQSLLGPCEPDDMAYMAVYLASDESRVVTGQVLSVDSGVTIY